MIYRFRITHSEAAKNSERFGRSERTLSVDEVRQHYADFVSHFGRHYQQRPGIAATCKAEVPSNGGFIVELESDLDPIQVDKSLEDLVVRLNHSPGLCLVIDSIEA